MTPERMASARVVFEIEKLAELSEKQRANVEKTVEKLKVDEDETKLRSVVGRPPVVTLPQLARRAGMGAALSVGAGAAGDLIRGNPMLTSTAKAMTKEIVDATGKKMLIPMYTNPELAASLSGKNVLSKAIMGATFGIGVPYIQYLADREAAKQGWY